MDEKEIQKKAKKSADNHMKNIKRLMKGDKPSGEEIAKMYDYLNYCWMCDRRIRFWDWLTFNVGHSFSGNYHRWYGCGD
jgi:hypothetical protein